MNKIFVRTFQKELHIVTNKEPKRQLIFFYARIAYQKNKITINYVFLYLAHIIYEINKLSYKLNLIKMNMDKWSSIYVELKNRRESHEGFDSHREV